MTDPPTPSRRMRLGLPTSPVVSGVMVAAFSPRPVSRMAAAASRTTSLAVARRFPRDRSNRSSSRSNPRTPGSSTRSASSSSSWPVSSPSQTTIWRPGDTPPSVVAMNVHTGQRVHTQSVRASWPIPRSAPPVGGARGSAQRTRTRACPASTSRVIQIVRPAAPSEHCPSNQAYHSPRPSPVRALARMTCAEGFTARRLA